MGSPVVASATKRYCFPFSGFFTMTVSSSHMMILLVLPSFIVAVSRYAPAFWSGVVTVIRLSKWFFRGFRSRSQPATFFPMY